MSELATSQPVVPISRSRVHRWMFATTGVACVGVGGVGVVVPGLPTTIFLLIASWCFTRSCPWLEERLLRNAFFSPFLRHLEPGTVMPRRARISSTIVMWIAITCSSLMLMERQWLVGVLIAAGVIGTWCIWRFRRS